MRNWMFNNPAALKLVLKATDSLATSAELPDYPTDPAPVAGTWGREKRMRTSTSRTIKSLACAPLKVVTFSATVSRRQPPSGS
jgi:hypothetical protein